MHRKIRGARAAAAALFAIGALVTAAVAPAAAITNGTLDGTGHPYVGLMVAKDATGTPLWRCSGTLLNSTVFITAGHCVEEPAASIELFFNTGPIPLGAGYPSGVNRCEGVTGYPCTGDRGGTPYQNPNWNPNAFFLSDLGIVVLDSPMVMSSYGALPAVGQLDGLRVGRRTTFTSVGYGLQKSFPDAAGWKDQAERTRYVAHPWLYQINTNFVGDFALLLSNNAAAGGTCFGDSGGPNFIGNSNVLAGVTSFGLNSTCAGTGGVYRLDRAVDRAWINGFLD